jgi:hypothetical protein
MRSWLLNSNLSPPTLCRVLGLRIRSPQRVIAHLMHRISHQAPGVKFPAVAVPVDTMMALAKRHPNTRERNLNLPSKVSGMPSKNQEDEMLGCRQARGREPNIHRPPVLSRVRPAVSRVKMLPKRERAVNSTIKW